jgi:hypothetical protein
MMNNEQKAQSLPSASLVQNGLLGDVDMEVLTLLCSDDDLRKWMTEPFSVGNQTCATNGWSLLVVDKKSDYPDMSEKTKSVYPVELSFTNKLEISKVKEAIDKIPLIDCYDKIVSKCDACYGNGNVDFEFEYKNRTYEIESECPVCEGEGQTEQVSKTPNGKKEIDLSKYARLGVNRLNVKRLFELIKVADLKGVNEVLYQLPVVNKPVAFKIGEDTILFLMPIAVAVDSEDCPNIA